MNNKDMVEKVTQAIWGSVDCITMRQARHAAIKGIEATGVERLTGEGWQPIETAPKDGTVFLAFTTEGVIGQAYAATEGHDGSFIHWEGPYSDGLSCTLEHSIGAPTHWMPLPEPPALQDGGKK